MANKFTKLLSIFLIAGAISAGSVAVAGCTHNNNTGDGGNGDNTQQGDTNNGDDNKDDDNKDDDNKGDDNNGGDDNTPSSLAQPVISAFNETTGELTWGAVTGAASYEIYDGTDKLGTSTTTSYTVNIESLELGPHSFTVVALPASGSTTTQSPASAAKAYTKYDQLPAFNYVSLNDKVITWTEVTGADRYEVYQGTNKVATIETTEELKYEITETSVGKHTYTVKAVTDTAYTLPAESEVVYIVAAPINVQLDKAATISFTNGSDKTEYTLNLDNSIYPNGTFKISAVFDDLDIDTESITVSDGENSIFLYSGNNYSDYLTITGRTLTVKYNDIDADGVVVKLTISEPDEEVDDFTNDTPIGVGDQGEWGAARRLSAGNSGLDVMLSDEAGVGDYLLYVQLVGDDIPEDLDIKITGNVSAITHLTGGEDGLYTGLITTNKATAVDGWGPTATVTPAYLHLTTNSSTYVDAYIWLMPAIKPGTSWESVTIKAGGSLAIPVSSILDKNTAYALRAHGSDEDWNAITDFKYGVTDQVGEATAFTEGAYWYTGTVTPTNGYIYIFNTSDIDGSFTIKLDFADNGTATEGDMQAKTPYTVKLTNAESTEVSLASSVTAGEYVLALSGDNLANLNLLGLSVLVEYDMDEYGWANKTAILSAANNYSAKITLKEGDSFSFSVVSGDSEDADRPEVTVSFTALLTPASEAVAPLPAPEISIDEFGEITWTAVPGATGYDVYRDNGDGTPVRIAQNLTITSYTISSGLEAGTYTYYVVALGTGAYTDSEKSNGAEWIVLADDSTHSGVQLTVGKIATVNTLDVKSIYLEAGTYIIKLSGEYADHYRVKDDADKVTGDDSSETGVIIDYNGITPTTTTFKITTSGTYALKFVDMKFDGHSCDVIIIKDDGCDLKVGKSETVTHMDNKTIYLEADTYTIKLSGEYANHFKVRDTDDKLGNVGDILDAANGEPTTKVFTVATAGVYTLRFIDNKWDGSHSCEAVILKGDQSASGGDEEPEEPTNVLKVGVLKEISFENLSRDTYTFSAENVGYYLISLSAITGTTPNIQYYYNGSSSTDIIAESTGLTTGLFIYESANQEINIWIAAEKTSFVLEIEYLGTKIEDSSTLKFGKESTVNYLAQNRSPENVERTTELNFEGLVAGLEYTVIVTKAKNHTNDWVLIYNGVQYNSYVDDRGICITFHAEDNGGDVISTAKIYAVNSESEYTYNVGLTLVYEGEYKAPGKVGGDITKEYTLGEATDVAELANLDKDATYYLTLADLQGCSSVVVTFYNGEQAGPSYYFNSLVSTNIFKLGAAYDGCKVTATKTDGSTVTLTFKLYKVGAEDAGEEPAESKSWNVTVKNGYADIESDEEDGLTVVYTSTNEGDNGEDGVNQSKNGDDFKMNANTTTVVITLTGLKAGQTITLDLSGYTGSTNNASGVKYTLDNATAADGCPETIDFTSTSTKADQSSGTFTFTVSADGTVTITLTRSVGKTARITAFDITVA